MPPRWPQRWARAPAEEMRPRFRGQGVNLLVVVFSGIAGFRVSVLEQEKVTHLLSLWRSFRRDPASSPDQHKLRTALHYLLELQENPEMQQCAQKEAQLCHAELTEGILKSMAQQMNKHLRTSGASFAVERFTGASHSAAGCSARAYRAGGPAQAPYRAGGSARAPCRKRQEAVDPILLGSREFDRQGRAAEQHRSNQKERATDHEHHG